MSTDQFSIIGLEKLVMIIKKLRWHSQDGGDMIDVKLNVRLMFLESYFLEKWRYFAYSL